ncbi:MAG TPA: phytoene/squalene synthase family protein [Fibrobacteria bacterium]|nr:phytoene/squalene synthase family protein [Fibrobacteria bacterium]
MFLISPKHAGSRSDASWKQAMAEGRIDDPGGFAAFMLGKTSRTFALNIQVLPAGLRRQVLLAYLFCRMADTLEDDGELEEAAKVRLLEAFRGLFPPDAHEAIRRSRLEAFRASLPPEWGRSERWDHLLVHHCDWIYPQLSAFPEAVVSAISRCVGEMGAGMIDFTRKQAKTRSGQVLIESIEDLDRYCYYVAGTVGNLLCDLFTLHSPLIGKKRGEALRALSVSFGLGLQLTNILKDVQEDRRRNVSYIPNSLLEAEHLTEAAFLASEGEGAGREKPGGRDAAARVMARLIGKAKSHLQDALDYSCLLPRLEPRLRLFCLWPLFMAVENLVLMGENLNGFQGEGKLKISRKQVKDIVGSTSLACWSNFWLRSMFRRSVARLDAGLARVPARQRPDAERAAGTVSGAVL